MTHSPRSPGSVTRRRFLHLAAVAGATAVLPTRSLAGSTPARWSDERTWGRSSPCPTDVARITGPTILDLDTRLAGLVVERDAELIFDPDRSATLTMNGNAIVEGVLRMHPSSPDILHRLVFQGVDEDAFVGGGHEPLATDVGLWVMESGKLDLKGSSKRAWTRVLGDLEAGQRNITLRDEPRGWHVGDDIVITPTLVPTAPQSSVAFDEAKIQAIHGRTLRISSATRFAHPEAPVGGGLGAEVLNLSRNARIEGTPSGRSHVFIHSTSPQKVKHAAIRHMGPRQPGDEEHPTVSVKGRYGLHFHECFGQSRGSDIVGVVVRDCGGHCFVAHNSHDISFRDCVSYNSWDDAYWWDARTTQVPDPPDSFSNGISYERCVAALVRFDPNVRGTHLSAFWLGTSTKKNSNACIGCVAVGVRGVAQSSGFMWPEDNEGIWVFKDCVAHNNAANGIFTWQNTPTVHVIENFLAYRNDSAGIEHGAYVNPYQYRDVKLIENRVAGVIEHARSVDPGDPETSGIPRLRYQNALIDGGGITRYGFLEGEINAPEMPPAVICGARIRGVDVAIEDGPTASPTFDVRASC